ncbi:MAG: hypothetical protein HY068_00560 [Burkholderiales bacterium]|nr:hypothetical protein [Burkholderiales bacterium]
MATQSPFSFLEDVFQQLTTTLQPPAWAVNWLVDHVRWDIEEDLARIVGDAPAHALGQAARRMAEAVRQFLTRASGTGRAA